MADIHTHTHVRTHTHTHTHSSCMHKIIQGYYNNRHGIQKRHCHFSQVSALICSCYTKWRHPKGTVSNPLMDCCQSSSMCVCICVCVCVYLMDATGITEMNWHLPPLSSSLCGYGIKGCHQININSSVKIDNSALSCQFQLKGYMRVAQVFT